MDDLASEVMAARPWIGEYPPGVPADVDLVAYQSMGDFLVKTAERFGGRVAYTQLGVEISYKTFDEYSARLAAYFQRDLGLRAGDRIALMMPNVIAYPIALFAALRAGLVVVNVNPLYTAPELVNLIADSSPRAIVVLETFAATLEKALRSQRVETVIVARVAEFQPFPRSLIVDWVVRRRKKLVPPWTIPGAVKFADALRRRSPEAFNAPPATHESVAFLQYTGGTTGKPKGVILTHGAVLADVLILAAWTAPIARPGAETTIIALPLYHVAALVCHSMVALHYGMKSVLVINPRDIPALVKDFENHKPSMFIGLNTLFNALVNNEAFRRLDFTGLRLTTAGGTATLAAVADRWHEVTGRPIFEAYGLSETAGAVTANPVTRTRFDGSIGVPLPCVSVEIRGENGAVVAAGTPGEICVKGPTLMRGYFNQPDETAKVLGADGFFATGDIGVIDARGVIKIVDRKKDMVLVSGFNVYPTEIEDVLARHPGISEVAVVGVKDARTGEAPVACVVRRDPALAEAAIIAYARENLAPYKTPRRVIFYETLPKTPVGKVLRRELRDELTP
jgi:long-chain acyl-CoA synthetase